MSDHHQLTITNSNYPGGLKIVECTECDYSFAAEIDEHNIIQYNTKVTINYGDLHAVHTFFQAPDEAPTLTISAELG